MTKRIHVSRPVCSATAAGRDFGPLKAPIKQIVSKPWFRGSHPIRCYQTHTIPDIQQMALGCSFAPA